MTSIERHQHMDAARVHAELTVHSLWLRYIALGGNGDAFDIDGYLQGLTPLEAVQQDVLAQALNEALEDDYHAHRVPLSEQPDAGRDDELERVIDHLLRGWPPPAGKRVRPPDVGHA